jgi:O-succinylbenzoic acid--CoA ligase
MRTSYTDIKLNGRYYNRRALLQLCSKKTQAYPVEPETAGVCKFICEWLNEQNYINLSTSGSTGDPKKIRLLKKNMIRSALLTQQFFNLDENKTALLCLPSGYIAGKMMIVRAFVTGYNLITVSPAANPFKGIRQYIDFAALTPYQLYHSPGDIRRLQVSQIIVGGGEIPPGLEKKINDIPADIYATYGMTETCSHVALRKANGKDATDMYAALKGISFSQDERKCLVIYAPMLSEHPVITNDVVELIDDGHFRWLGRYDNVINTAGIKVYPEVIEKKLYGIINRPFFISSIADPELSDKAVIVVEGTRFAKDREFRLLEQFRARLDRFENPKEFFYTKHFVYSESGKILREKTMQQIKQG